MAKKDQTEFSGDESFEGGDASVMVDLSNVEEAKFEAVPRGTYSATIESCEHRLSQNSGQPMWAMQLTILDGEFEGRKVFDNVSFSPKAYPFTKKTLAVIAPELLSGPFDPEKEAPSMEGKQVKIRTKVEKYEGNDQTRITQYLPVEDSFLVG